MRALFTAFAAVGLAMGASAATVEFNFPINVEQEVPAPTIPAGVPTPSGQGLVTVDTDANTVTWEIDYSNLTGDIVAPGAHLHGPADFGETAGLFVFLAGGDGAPLPQPATGTLSGSASITDEEEGWLLDGLVYVNIHTAANQPGEIRGQVVPEPASLTLLGLAATLCFRRR